MDRQCLRSLEAKPGIHPYFRDLDPQATALLVEVRADSRQELQSEVAEVLDVLAACQLSAPASFIDDPTESKRLWEIRKGLYPSLGQARPPGTTIIIEDVAFPLERLADAAVDLRRLLEEYGYQQAVIFGHALQGNLHFVFCTDFTQPEEVLRYEAFLDAAATLVASKYDGSLKAEHGTGRNMAPFVEREWGAEAVGIMREIKQIFDPNHLLNPGVILNPDPRAHVSQLKDMPRSHSVIEKCTECGFCERSCPSKNLTLSPRQRIAVWREISRLTATGEDRRRLAALRKGFDYQGNETCAGDGLCATLCPVGIDTGRFIRSLRELDHSSREEFLAKLVAKNFGAVLSSAAAVLRAVGVAHALLGTSTMYRLSGALRALSGNRFPEWNPTLPGPPPRPPRRSGNHGAERAIYFPSCVSRLFGVTPNGPYADSQTQVIERLLSKAGYEVSYPEALATLCCGMSFSSKGYASVGEAKRQQALTALAEASEDGRHPIVLDTSPCAQALRTNQQGSGLPIFDLPEFLLGSVVPRLKVERKRGTVAVHVPCSLTRTGQQSELIKLAQLYAEKVCLSPAPSCCGFAGDKGFTTPELCASALISLQPSLARLPSRLFKQPHL
jgi:D-lactate dehydrogenase